MQDRIKLPLHPVTCSVDGWSEDEARVLREFAQAVARECAEICDDLGGEIDERSPDETRLAANSLAHAIRARFGIEGE